QYTSQMVFGSNVEAMRPGQKVVVDARAFGWPVQSLAQVKPGDYWVQAVLNRYETFHRADGTTIKLAPDHGEGQHWNTKPGTPYPKPVGLHIDPEAGGRVAISLAQTIAPIPEKPDPEFIRHIRIKSEALSKFWGRPVYLRAHVLVPAGFDQHPEAHYPLMV